LPLPFVEVEAVGTDGHRCAAGETGVLRLRGPNVGPGYTDPARNVGTFHDGWLNTGDIGHVDAQGRVFVTGRAKDVIIRGGHNIDPQVIEEAMLQHPDVLMAAAVGAPDDYAGELPVVFVALRPGATAGEASLMATAQRHIPERPACPKRIHVLASLPTTAIGKVYKPALRAIACQYVLQDRLETAGLADKASVIVADAASGMEVRFTVKAGADTGRTQASIKDLMQPYAFGWELTL
jgi:fatty-acyl-CoA synthase